MSTSTPISTPTESAEADVQAARLRAPDRQLDAAPPWVGCALDRLTEGVLITDASADPAELRIVYVNDAICRLSGYSRDELIGRHPWILDGRDTDPNESKQLREQIRAGREYRGELRHRRHDGSSLLAEWIVTPVRDEQQQITHFVARVRDLTLERDAAEALRQANDDLEQRMTERTSALAALAIQLQKEIAERTRSEQALRLSEQRFRMLGDCSPMGIFFADAASEFRYVNPSLQAITGVPDTELLGAGYASHIHPDDRQEVFGRWHRQAGWEHKGAVTFRVITSAGDVRWVQARTAPIHDQAGELLGHVGAVQDITDQRKAEDALRQAHAELELRVDQRTRELSLANEWLATEVRERRQIERALRESEVRWRTLVENAPAYIMLTDVDGTIRFINRTRPGISTELIIGQCVYDHVHPGTFSLFTERLKECIASGEPTDFEATGFDAEGGILWYHTRVAPIKRGEQVTGLLFVSTDITDRLKAEEQVRVRQTELAHVARIHAATELAGGLAHEINQPLTAIASSAEAILRFLRKGESLDRFDMIQIVAQVADQARRAAEVLRHLRGFLRKAPPSRTPQDINSLVSDAITLMQHEAKQCRVAIETNLAEELPPLVLDPVQIQQVLVNLLKNACEALENTPIEEREILVATRRADESSIEISVADRGDGVDPALTEQIFNTFFTTKPTGLGLGLSISRSIVQDHGGQMWMSRNPLRGVTFHCRLPFLGGKP